MKIKQPLCITSRLLPGVKIGEATISIEYAHITPDERRAYRWYINLPGKEFTGNDLASGVGGGSLQSGLESLLGFLSAFAEAHAYQDQTGQECENADLFPAGLAEWAMDNALKISMLVCELEEKPGEFIVE